MRKFLAIMVMATVAAAVQINQSQTAQTQPDGTGTQCSGYMTVHFPGGDVTYTLTAYDDDGDGTVDRLDIIHQGIVIARVTWDVDCYTSAGGGQNLRVTWTQLPVPEVHFEGTWLGWPCEGVVGPV